MNDQPIDPYRLQRFVDAQKNVIDDARAELRNGRKSSHWMWFVFPQFHGLGHSQMAKRYAIFSREEAQAYLQHPTLGPRLMEFTRLVTQIEGRTLEDILGYPDNLKFQSSMTLFAHVAADNQVFLEALKKHCGGRFDSHTSPLL